MFALFDFTGNAKDLASADMHFAAAAEFGIIAGVAGGATAAIRSSRSAGTGSGAGDFRGLRDSGGRGGHYDGIPPETLAAGAASGRFGSPGSGVVIIRRTQEFENVVAEAVNGAVSRGMTVTATQSQRGAPVGH